MPLSKSADPRTFVLLKPLPIGSPKGQKLQARSTSVYSALEPSREQVFKDNYQRRQDQLSRQGYWAPNWRPYQGLGDPLHLEPRQLILRSLGQDDQVRNEDPSLQREPLAQESAAATSQRSVKNESLSAHLSYLKSSEDERQTLRKHLSSTRKMMSAVKQGRGYLQLLQNEEHRMASAQILKMQQLAEEKRNEMRPPSRLSDDDSDSPDSPERFFKTEVPAGRSPKTSATVNKNAAMRPFTPVHSSLTSPQLSDTPVEVIFRQLCSLYWLLDVLTTESTGGIGPVSSCWDIRDPGGSRLMTRRTFKEKNIELRWDHFLSPPKVKKNYRALRRQSLKPRRSYFPSSSRMSMSSTLTANIGSMSSLVLGSEDLSNHLLEEVCEAEDSESLANGSGIPNRQDKQEVPLSPYLQKLLEYAHQSAEKELQCNMETGKIKLDGYLTNDPACEKNRDRKEEDTPQQRPQSCPVNQSTVTSKFIESKQELSSEMRQRFLQSMREASSDLNSTLDMISKKRREKCVHIFQSLDKLKDVHQGMESIRACSKVAGCRDEQNQLMETSWLSHLLSLIPRQALDNHNIHKILDKLSRFGDRQSLRIEPQHFVNVLSAIRTWELCSPDLCVAIEIVREHVVQMPKEDYETWLKSRGALPTRPQSAPQ
ncbi:coiled-coil domain-containing protein 60-like [Erpetoichthys calabaricus]|uniref:coiled-coil domain-containing protein 60-like n=1 Tax=Erpetoichthys calabaricus TaxID=27687 RepID=UPI0022349226|nr:coiled-coil domain-containing protein 60-like [Erpetoichthys calabaricus]